MADRGAGAESHGTGQSSAIGLSVLYRHRGTRRPVPRSPRREVASSCPRRVAGDGGMCVSCKPERVLGLSVP